MLFIEIDGANYSAAFQPTTTQRGKVAMRVISDEAPIAENGFRIVDKNGIVVSDKSDFVYLYSQDEHCKVYTKEPEEIFPANGYETGNIPPSPYAILSRRISQVNNQVNTITPYVESKTAYIDDTYVLFDIAREGNISVFMIDNEGQNVPFEFEQINGQIKVSFEKRDSLATVTIQIQ